MEGDPSFCGVLERQNVVECVSSSFEKEGRVTCVLLIFKRAHHSARSVSSSFRPVSENALQHERRNLTILVKAFLLSLSYMVAKGKNN